MKTSKEWWSEVKNSPEKLISWLKNQYHGEVTAAVKIKELFLSPSLNLNDKDKQIIERIAKEEEAHAKWVRKLLLDRGQEASVLDKEERYWNQVLPKEDDASVAQLAAIAHHAETMRLERIRAICEDLDAPEDILKVFQAILPMEENHAKWFKELSNPEEISNTLYRHQNGLNALGLVI